MSEQNARIPLGYQSARPGWSRRRFVLLALVLISATLITIGVAEVTPVEGPVFETEFSGQRTLQAFLQRGVLWVNFHEPPPVDPRSPKWGYSIVNVYTFVVFDVRVFTARLANGVTAPAYGWGVSISAFRVGFLSALLAFFYGIWNLPRIMPGRFDGTTAGR